MKDKSPVGPRVRITGAPPEIEKAVNLMLQEITKQEGETTFSVREEEFVALILGALSLFGWSWEHTEKGTHHFLQHAFEHFELACPETLSFITNNIEWQSIYMKVLQDITSTADKDLRATLTDVIKKFDVDLGGSGEPN
jgi:hypothetical protein